jgi:hypothetical protein
MNTRTSLTVRAALIVLGTATSFTAHAGSPANTSSDAQSMARALLSGTSAHVVSFAARSDAAAAPFAYLDAQQHAARLLTGAVSDRPVASGRARSLTATTGALLTARNADLPQAARRLLQGQSVD